MSSRSLDPAVAAALPASTVILAHLAMLQFRTSTKYVWSGPGPLVWNGNTFLGVGSLGRLGDISEGSDVQAEGTTVGLSGIDPVLLGESLTDIRSGAMAKRWLALLRPDLSFVGPPQLVFRGTVDVPTVTPDADKISIMLSLENRLVNLGRATNTKYTAADQRRLYPNDIAFNWVELLNDASFKEGQ